MVKSSKDNETSSVEPRTYEIKDSIAKEFERQFDETLRRSDAIDTKIGLILGFIFITIGLLINKDLLASVFQSPQSIIALFGLGVALIIVSVFSGILAIFFRTFQFGPDRNDLYINYNDKPEGFVKGVIAGKLNADAISNFKAIDTKVFFAKVMFVTFSLGLVAIIILEIGCFGKLW
jgi:hypothetical protein